MLAVDGRGRERAQAGEGVRKVSIIGVSGRNSAPSLVSLIPMMGHYFLPPPTDTIDGALFPPPPH
ncbi:unnamed protein product [Staurois parvus]|uniref:Uncharacterized protein n=1 Tax=Staurois parvus TaxID=386267 RepID=A0ABN9BR16_9NEOB|nr:unnamed protein product [Staurois parvus]